MAVPISKDLLYLEILGIPRQECPPNHYRLLGINRFEQDPRVIQQALEQRIRLIQVADHGEHREAMVQHVREVGHVLLSPHLKQAYDGILRQQTIGGAVGSPPAHDDYQLKPPAPPMPSAKSTAFPGQSPSPDRVPQGPLPAGTRPPRTKPGGMTSERTSPPRPVKRRSVVRVPIWVRVLVISGFIAAHGAIYWYAYNYINRSQTTSQSTVAQAETLAGGPVHPSNSQGDALSGSQPQDASRVRSPAGNVLPSDNDSASARPLDVPVDSNKQAGLLLPRNDGTNLEPVVPPPADLASSTSSATVDNFSATKQSPGMPMPAPVASKPFDALEPYVGLPEQTPETSTPAGAVVLGQIGGDAAGEMELELESGAVNLVGRELSIATLASEEDSDIQRRWDVKLVVQSSNDADEGQPVAHLHTDDEGQLKFYWDSEAEPGEAAQLRNALLLCSHSEDNHVMALRKPMFLPAIGVDLTARKLESVIPLTTPPAERTIRLEIAVVEAPIDVTAEPANRIVPPGNNVVFTMGSTNDLVQGELLFASKQESDNQLRVAVIPRYRQASNGKYSELAHDGLVQQIARLQRLLSDDAVDLAAAYTNLPVHLSNLSKLRSTRPRNNDEAGAQARAALQLEGYIKKCESTIRAKTRTMPSSYDALNRIVEAARLARQLNARAAIQFRVFAETPSGPLVLAEANHPPEWEQKQDEFAFLDNTPGPAGIWVNLQPEFQIVELTSGGSVSAKDASGKKSLGSGRWTRTGDLVEISVNGKSGKFKFHNGVAMSSDDGQALFRKF